MELIVWHEPGHITHAEAEGRTRYEKHPALADFARELAQEIEKGLIKSGDETHVRLSPKDSQVPRIRYLAGKHRLVCYDPAQKAVLNPPVHRRAGAHELSFCLGHAIDDPSPRHLGDAVRNLTEHNWFIVLDDGDDHFVQVARGEGTHMLEFKDGQHFQTEVLDAEAVIDALIDQSDGDKQWRDRFVWRPMER